MSVIFNDEVGYARAPSKDDIAGMTDIRSLLDEQEHCEEQEIVIRTILEFPDQPSDANWRRRARGALISHRVAVLLIERRIKEIRRERNRELEAAKKAEKAAAAA
jgi:hypothetical protein